MAVGDSIGQTHEHAVLIPKSAVQEIGEIVVIRNTKLQTAVKTLSDILIFCHSTENFVFVCFPFTESEETLPLRTHTVIKT